MSGANETPNVMVRLKDYPLNGGGYSGRRSFYVGGAADDYMKYIEKGIVASADEQDVRSDYIKCIDDAAKSVGLFGEGGLLSRERKAELRKQFRATGGNIWDMIISFKEGYGDRYMRDTATAHALLKAHLNRFFKNAGLVPTMWLGMRGFIPIRITSICMSVFARRRPMFLRREKDGKFYHYGKLRQTSIDGFKISIEQYFSDTTM
ncbi:MAG: hypothetical protein LBL66_02810 [Clostridiales bacterium]|jgi:hypothetical protein|nr:hypothetical protein [Clostridiales bacterium]